MQDAALGDALDAPNEPQLGPWGVRIHALTKGFAIAGGVGFIVLVLMSLVSIVGRKLASTPITGDIELMQMAGAVAAAAMLPFCEMERHHLRVDFSRHACRKVPSTDSMPSLTCYWRWSPCWWHGAPVSVRLRCGRPGRHP